MSDHEQAATMTIRQVAQKLGLSPNTVYSMVREHRFPLRPLPLPQRKLLFSRAAVDRLVESQK